jgi:hypothetical protein
MKLSIAAAAALPLLASGYTMGGPFGRPVIITGGVGPCGPSGRCAPGNADQAFETLKKELKSHHLLLVAVVVEVCTPK